MDGLSISKVAERTGFPPSTLRFYEQSGLVCPDRTESGYRSYGERDIEVLSFIGRAKSFGLSLEEITDLLVLLDEDQCAPVQGRLRALIGSKIADARQRIAELEQFAMELEQVAATLDGHTPQGPCDDSCGCTTDPAGPVGVSITATSEALGEPVSRNATTPSPAGPTANSRRLPR